MRYGLAVCFLLSPLVYLAASHSLVLGWVVGPAVAILAAAVTWIVETRRLAGWGKFGYSRSVSASDWLKR